MQPRSQSAAPIDFGDMFEEEEVGAGDEALAVKPWMSAVKHMQPTNPPHCNARKPPKAQMELKWAYGFRSFDTRNNLYFNNENHAVYCTAGVGVVHDLEQKTQQFFNEHKEDIVALAYDETNNIVATGQMAGKEMREKTKMNAGRQKPIDGKLVDIYIWNASTCEQIGPPIRGLHRRAVRHLEFDHGGLHLMSVGEDDKHHMGIYKVEQEIVKNKPSSRRLMGSCPTMGCTDAHWASNGRLIGALNRK